uniref:Uncharacterized protein n=1 Tax=Glossina palpalis gambiensis TaxID=67801 RepID=A0A1B0BNW8_9MUSC
MVIKKIQCIVILLQTKCVLGVLLVCQRKNCMPQKEILNDETVGCCKRNAICNCCAGMEV